MMLVGACSNSSVPTRLQAPVEPCCSLTPGTPARSVADVARSRKRRSKNGGTPVSAELNLTAITTLLSISLPSDGGFRRRKLPEKPRGFSPVFYPHFTIEFYETAREAKCHC